MEFDQRSGTLGEIHGSSLFDLDEDNAISSHNLEEANYEATHVLLFKKVPYEATELEIINLCHKFGVVSDIYLMRNKGYAFIQFQMMKAAMACFEIIKKEGAQIRGENIFVFYTGKREIYKQDTLSRPPSRSLLLICYTSSELITSFFISKLLAPFGRISQIKFLQPNPATAFVEMEDIGSAITIRETLNNTIYANSFKVSVAYVSKQQVLVQPDQNQYQLGSLQHLSSGMPTSLGELYPPGMNLGFPRSEGDLGDFKYQNRKPQSMQSMQQQSSLRSFHNLDEGDAQDQHNNKNHNTILIKNLPRGLNCGDLFRLCGMFGNVMRVKIFYSNPENALIEFQDNTQAMVAKTHLNNCSIRGNNVFITVSKNPIIFNVPTIPEGNKFLGDYRESKEHRYKIVGSKNFRNIAPPSPVLHLSNLCEDKADGFYKDLFRVCGRIKKSLVLKGDTKNMLVEMENVGQAVEVLMQFHNFDIEGMFLKVSFSKYQTIKS